MEIKGMPASLGNANGTARIIEGDNFSEFKKGEVLVTEMTDPSMTIIMGKAAAIVTDLGGMSCHAAIVSRELGIPCIVGTENATKLIKTGQKLEINADNGTIKIEE